MIDSRGSGQEQEIGWRRRQQEDFKRALGEEGSGTGIWREKDGGPVSQTDVDGIGALASPIQPIYAGFIGVGVRLSESKHHRRRPVGYVHLRRLAAPAGLGSGRPVRLVHTPAFLGLALTRLVDLLMRDLGVLTPDEVVGLMAGLLTSRTVPTGTTRPTNWDCQLIDLPRPYAIPEIEAGLWDVMWSWCTRNTESSWQDRKRRATGALAQNRHPGLPQDHLLSIGPLLDGFSYLGLAIGSSP